MRIKDILLQQEAPRYATVAWAKPINDSVQLNIYNKGEWHPINGCSSSEGGSEDNTESDIIKVQIPQELVPDDFKNISQSEAEDINNWVDNYITDHQGEDFAFVFTDPNGKEVELYYPEMNDGSNWTYMSFTDKEYIKMIMVGYDLDVQLLVPYKYRFIYKTDHIIDLLGKVSNENDNFRDIHKYTDVIFCPDGFYDPIGQNQVFENSVFHLVNLHDLNGPNYNTKWVSVDSNGLMSQINMNYYGFNVVNIRIIGTLGGYGTL